MLAVVEYTIGTDPEKHFIENMFHYSFYIYVSLLCPVYHGSAVRAEALGQGEGRPRLGWAGPLLACCGDGDWCLG